jgi:hypothetical protein
MKMSSSLSGHFKLTIVHIFAIAETISIVLLVWERETPCPHLRALISTMERGEECFVTSSFKGQLDDGCVYVGMRNMVRQAYTYVEKMLENERTFGFSFEIGLAHLFHSISTRENSREFHHPLTNPTSLFFNSPICQIGMLLGRNASRQAEHNHS